jgi:endoglucanase
MKPLHRILSLTIVSAMFMTAGCINAPLAKKRLATSDTTMTILVDQVGYYPDGQKIALIRGNAEKFDVIDAVTGKIVFSGNPGEPGYWNLSGDTVRPVDISQVTEPGMYRICLAGTDICSPVFRIGDHVYSDITRAAVKAFYYNRSGYEITAQYGSKWARPAGHPDTAVIVHESAASKTRPAGTVISSPGGWYDAGDYNKYVVNSSITGYTLLLFYQLYPEYCRSLDINIPESGNDIPDIIDELLYNFRWYLTMQDPEDGGVYHKLTTKNFDGFEMPDSDLQPRYVVQKSTAATLDFAALTAMFYRVFANDPSEELRSLSAKCIEASEKAMKWAEKHPDIIYRQPKDITTGTYGDDNISDELFWARAELALAKNTVPEPGFVTGVRAGTPSWNQSETLGLISLALSDNEPFGKVRDESKALLVTYADELLKKADICPYLISLDWFAWGSNSDVANQAMLEIIAMKLTGDNKYMPYIQNEVDYLLGRNATGYCFVTGFGTLSPMHIHHRPSGADGVPEPVPGFLVGGPNTVVMNDCGPLVKRSGYPAKSYNDSECSYSTNEICINWNAPLVFVLGTMDAMGN